MIPSVSIKDHTVGGPLVILNACLSLSWPDNLIQPRSRVAQLRWPYSTRVCTLDGSKDVWGAGCEPKGRMCNTSGVMSLLST